MPIAQDTNDWEAMLYGKPSVPTKSVIANNTQAVVDNQEGDPILEPEPVVTYDYEAEMKEIRRRSRRTVTSLAKLVFPKDMLEEDYVKDKIEQDIQALSELYWTRRSNEIMKLSVMDCVAKGDTQPRRYDVYKELTQQINDNNKQIIATEAELRKTYIDLKYEIQRRRVEDMADAEPQKSTKKVVTTTQEPLAVEAHTGTKSLIEQMKDRQRNAMKEKMVDFVP